MTRALLIFVWAGLLLAQSKQPAKSKPAPPKPAPPKATVAPQPEAPAQMAAYPLESLRVEGLKQIPAARVVAASGLKVGLAVTKTDFDEARDRLVATGAFENVGYEYKPSSSGNGYDAVIQVIEAPQLFPLRFEDIPVPEATIRATLRKLEPVFDEKIPPTAAVLDRYTKAVQQAAGIPVKGRVSAEHGTTEIIFAPTAGRPNIAEVRFTGNQVLPSTTLTRTLAGVAVGVPFSETSFRQILEAAIRPLYEARGRLRVEFPSITSARAERVDGVVITTTVREGEVYKLSSVRWEGVVGVLRESVEKAADIKTGDVANFDDITNALRRVNARYLAVGFLKQTAKVERSVDDKMHEVGISIKVDAGPQYLMGKLRINGLDIFAEPVVRKMWRLEEGKPFTQEYPDQFLKRVRDEDMFDNLGKTTAATDVNEVAHVVDVILNFTGDRAEKLKQAPPN